MPAVAAVAGIAGRARVDHQDLAATAHQLVVGVAVENEIGLGFAEAIAIYALVIARAGVAISLKSTFGSGAARSRFVPSQEPGKEAATATRISV